MKYHEPYTIFERKLPPTKKQIERAEATGKEPKGRVVYYYRVWLGENKRSVARSTGATTKSAARKFCEGLRTKGELIPTPKKGQPKTFKEFAKGFWNFDTSDYIDRRLKFGDPNKPPISRRTADTYARIVTQYLNPQFGTWRLDEIVPTEIEEWALELRDKQALSGKRVNNIVSVLRTMLREAHRRGLLTSWDPRQKDAVQALGNDTKKRGHVTVDEMLTLFATENIEKAWKGNTIIRAINYVAAATGMRQGEILALTDEDVFEDHISVTKSYGGPRYGVGPTKNRRNREVPIAPSIYQMLRPFLGSGNFLFSYTKGETPITAARVTVALQDAFAALGIDSKTRNIDFHSWRGFNTSLLRARGIPDDLIRKNTGHETPAMLETYTSYNADAFAAIAAAQAEVFK